jgi:hypothetical protein
MAGTATAQSEHPQWWEVFWDFATHVFVGLLIFLVIASVAFAIEFVVRAFETARVNQVITLGLRVAEYATFCADLLMFLLFIWRTTAQTLRSLK